MAGERILLVEDNAQNRRLAQFLLTSHGYIVYEAGTGEEALMLARRHRPDLILMDLRLPDLDGLAVTRALKANAATTQSPVVALTAFAMEGDREKALQAGCDAYITKAIDTRDLPIALRRYLTQQREKGVSRAMEKGIRILVVDDHEQNLTLMQVMLRRSGYEAVLAGNGEEALRLVEADPPDLVILDVMMPGMDGIEVCRRLKDHEATRLIPVVIMTALDQLEDKIRGIEAGADDFLTKPVNQSELMARVRTVLRLKQTIDRQMGRLLSVKEHLAKFVPMAVRRLVEAHPEAPGLARREQDVSILTVDVSGYTRLNLLMDQERVDALVERYFSHFLDRIQEHGGDIAETSGDGMMVVVHHDDPREHVRQAARAALRILDITSQLNRQQPEAGGPIAVHIGVNSGRAMVGSNRFQSRRGARWTFTANGSVANLAARLVDAAAPDMVLVGVETAQRIQDSFDVEPLGARVLKNFDAIEVYRLLGERSVC